MCVLVLAVVAGVAPAGPWAQHEGHSDTDHGHGGEHDATVRHRFDDVDRWVRRFDDPERDTWQRPDEVIRFLSLSEGAVVADVGAGTGYFSVRLADAVGPEGRVLAVDIEPALVEHMKQRALDAGLSWMEPRLAEPNDPDLPQGAVDRILIVDTWHHIDDRLDYLAHLARALAPEGEVVVVDFHEGELPVGPPPGHKLSEQHVREEFAKAGWKLVRASDALPYQYVLAFRPGT